MGTVKRQHYKMEVMGGLDILQVFGVIFLTKIGIGWLYEIFMGMKLYIFTKITSPNLKSRFGDWALVTGCTGGIGEAYTKALAAQGMNIVLVSRSLEKLNRLSQELEGKFCVKTKIIVIDFRRPETLGKIKSEVEASKLDIGVL